MPQSKVILRTSRQDDKTLHFSGADKTTLFDENSSEYDVIREIRKDATCAMARAFFLAPILTATWTIQANTERQRNVLQQVLDMKGTLHTTAARAALDYGWNAWEARPERRVKGVWRVKTRALRHDITEFYVQRGEVAGVKNSKRNGDPIYIPFDRAFAVCANGEYDSPYGESVTLNARRYVEYGIQAEEQWARYGKRVAGSHWVIKFPVGVTRVYNGITGIEEEKDNSVIADEILDGLESSAKVALPIDKDTSLERAAMRTDNSTDGTWSIELITDHGNAADVYVMRERAIAVNKFRAFLLPERSISEGSASQGGKSDATAHADAALLVVESWSEDLLASLNGPRGIVRFLFELHDMDWYEGVASIKQSPLKDTDRAFMRELIRTVVNNIGTAGQLDLNELADRADVPLRFNTSDPNELLRLAAGQPGNNNNGVPTGIGLPGSGSGNTPAPGGANPNSNAAT